MSQDLSGDVSGGSDFATGGHHLEWAPVLVPDEVSYEPFARVCVELIGGIGHTGAIRDEFLRICDAQICKVWCGLAVGYQANIHHMPFKSLSVSGCMAAATASTSNTSSMLTISFS